MPTPQALLGRWHITAMELWSKDAIDLLGPAFIEFDDKGGGQFTFIAVVGYLHCRYSTHKDLPSVSFTWDGSDECDRASGSGWAEVQPDGTLTGKICVHDGDDSGFVARRE